MVAIWPAQDELIIWYNQGIPIIITAIVQGLG